MGVNYNNENKLKIVIKKLLVSMTKSQAQAFRTQSNDKRMIVLASKCGILPTGLTLILSFSQ